ncbi:hypothetical protein TARUN_5687 [Trichoderma arundinaceum]|uniref:Extracellular serine-rich n=1 Tax=Trichoderma arundinaceum TaxID=490622 RepID=A0A395NKZ7_TRIAR|nr:hypothetical protein TARUN_5687 [Trichoderma arundinaceum]
MPSFKSLFSAIAFACLVGADTIKITATSSNTFDPSTVKASDGDVLEFHFEAKNHTVVSGDYRYPCSPMELGTGFFSGFLFATKSGEANKVFRVEVNGTDPIPFYSSQGNECASGMVGIINPKGNVTLADYKRRASVLARSVSPGRTTFGGEIASNDKPDDSDGDNGKDGGDDGDNNGKGGSSGSNNDKGSGDSSGGSSSDKNKDGKGNSGVSVSVSMATLVGAMGLAFLMA